MSQTQLLMRRPDLANLPPLPHPPAGMTLRTAQPDDADGMARLLTTAFAEEWTVERVLGALLDAPDVKTTFVITSGKTTVATASARLLPDAYPGSGYVHWVGADPEFSGQGLGYLASLAVLHEFVRLGCRDAVLETDASRLPAIKTYLRLGFQPVYRDDSHAARWDAVQAQFSTGRKE